MDSTFYLLNPKNIFIDNYYYIYGIIKYIPLLNDLYLLYIKNTIDNTIPHHLDLSIYMNTFNPTSDFQILDTIYNKDKEGRFKILIDGDVKFYYSESLHKLFLSKNIKIIYVDTVYDDYETAEVYKIISINIEKCNLSFDQNTAIHDYSSRTYELINSTLYNDELNAEAYKYITLIDEAFKSAPISSTPITVYRGTNNILIFGLNKAYISTSIIKDVSLMYMNINCCLYKITIPPGIPYLYIVDQSKFEYEEEILLPRNLYINLINEEIVNDITIYNVEISLIETTSPPIIYSLDDVLNMSFPIFYENFDNLTYYQKYNYLHPTIAKYIYEFDILIEENTLLLSLTLIDFGNKLKYLTIEQQYIYYIYFLNKILLYTYPSFDKFII